MGIQERTPRASQDLNSLRVAIVSSTPYAPPWSEGGRNLIRRMACEFSQRGIITTIIGPKTPGAIACGDFGERVVNVASSLAVSGWMRALVQSRVWLSAALAVRGLTSETDVVLLLACLTSALGLRTAFLKRLSSTPLVVYVTGLGRPRFGFRWGLSADRILVGSEFLQRWLPEADVIYPFLPVGLEHDEASLGKPDGVFRVLFLGSLEPERGVEYLLRAMTLVRERTSGKIELIVAWNGEGAHNYEKIQRLVDTLGIRSMVDWRGRVDTRSLYRESDVVVIPRVAQTRMSFPIRIVEALHMHKPVIASRVCGMENLVEGWGIAVEPRDADSLARAILQLADDTTLREQLVENCAKAAQRFDSCVSLDRLVGELRKVASDGS